MSGHEKACEELVEKCKHEAKQLAEFTATRRKLHWTHPSFISFCVSVEDILSYGVKKKYQYYRSKVLTPSGRVLQDVGKVLPAAAAIYDKCFSEAASERGKEDYYLVHVVSPAEKKVLWLRAALIEGHLQAIVETILGNPKQFYTKQSVLCHEVYGEIFKYLIDGPCAIKYSRLKISDVSMGSSPAEIVQRHNQVLSISSIKGYQDDGRGDTITTEAAWEHVQSLYQSNASTCLFGKNNIMVQPAGFSQPLPGYLTLQEGGSLVMLKWIPNSLLQESTSAHISLWKTVISIDIVMEIAHIHCHRAPGRSAELILIGYDGIAHPPLLFPHQPSFFLFLECLENCLLPQGCLEPPLWYIKEKTSKAKNLFHRRRSADHHRTTKVADEGEWFDAVEVWTQVFRIRYGPHPVKEEVQTAEASTILASQPQMPPTLALNLTQYSGRGFDSSESGQSDGEGSDQTPFTVTLEKPGSLVRRDLENYHSKMSRQLIARYFYSWLSHCRHMSKVRANVSHLVGSSALCPESHAHSDSSLSRDEWNRFLLAPKDQGQAESSWRQVVQHIYLRGADHEIRKEVWPYLLGLYPVDSSPEERAAILERCTENYKTVLGVWQQVEATKKEIEMEAMLSRLGVGKGGASGKDSPTHRVGGASGDNSPTHRVGGASGKDSPTHRGGGASGDNSPTHKEGGASREDSPTHGVGGASEDDVGGASGEGSPTLSYLTTSVESLERSTGTPPEPADVSHDDEQQTHEQPVASHDQPVASHDQSHDTIPDASPRRPPGNGGRAGLEGSLLLRPGPEALVMNSMNLDSQGREFVKNLYNIDKDVPRCDRDYWYFKDEANLVKVRNVVCSFVWTHLSEGYSQGMCDLLSPLLVVLESEPLAYACYLKLMEVAIKLFPPNTTMNTRLANVQTLLQVMEPDFYQYLSVHPLGDGVFYAYRWLLVTFKREFSYVSVFRLWETIWAARNSNITANFEEFVALSIMKQFKTAIMDAHLDPSDILNLFTDLANKQAIDVGTTIRIAQETIHTLQSDLTKKDC